MAKTLRFKVGDKVILRKDSTFYYASPNQLNNVVGVIIEESPRVFDYTVQWDGGSNAYNDEDLDPAATPTDILKSLKTQLYGL